MSISIILTDDHKLVREGIRLMLSACPDMQVCGEAAGGSELLNLLTFCNPDIILLDISLPGMNGIEVCRQINDLHPNISVIMLSMHIQEEYVYKSIQSGAKAYLPKDTGQQELIKAIRTVYAGEEYINPEISTVILTSFLHNAKASGDEMKGKIERLSPRESELLVLFAEGISNREIAEKLFISVRTVETHKTHIMQKLELGNTVELVKIALRNQLIDL